MSDEDVKDIPLAADLDAFSPPPLVGSKVSCVSLAMLRNFEKNNTQPVEWAARLVCFTIHDNALLLPVTR